MVQYTTDPSYANLSLPVWGPINSLFALPYQAKEASTYYHQVTVTIDNSLIVVLRSVHAVEDCSNPIMSSPSNVSYTVDPHLYGLHGTGTGPYV